MTTPQWRIDQLRLANANGKALEVAIATTCEAYRLSGFADIRRRAPVRTGQSARGVSGRSAVDFAGKMPDGQRIAFDVKNITRTETYRHAPAALHQLTFLRRIQVHGGVGFLLLYDSDLDRMWRCDGMEQLLTTGSVHVRTIRRSTGRVLSDWPEVQRVTLRTPTGTAVVWHFLAS